MSNISLNYSAEENKRTRMESKMTKMPSKPLKSFVLKKIKKRTINTHCITINYIYNKLSLHCIAGHALTAELVWEE